MKYYDDIPVWGDIDERTLEQIKRCRKTSDKAAVMADNHLGYGIPIGAVVAYKDKISPTGVGYDISCGVKGLRLDVKAKEIKPYIDIIMDDIVKEISFGVGRTNNVKVEHELFEYDNWNHPAVKNLKKMAEDQLGTVGSGNHFLDILEDEDGYTWITCHFGSRGLGHKTATWFLQAGGAKDGMDVEPLVLDVCSDLGRGYLECMELAGQYAYAGRDWVCQQVNKIVGGTVIDEVHNHHNFAWAEQINGETHWVVRKGATPAYPGQRGVIGGSMGDITVIVEGVESEESKQALYSTVHGAGRVMSRTAAKGKFIKDSNGKKQRQQGLVRHDEWMKWINDMGVCLRGADLDEAPQAYRRLPEVLEHHKNTIKILHTLTPIGVAMAGSNIVDPFKD